MAIRTRVLESGLCEITQDYRDGHGGIDLVRDGYRLDNITAHSDGTVVQVIKNVNVNTPNEPTNPGNMVRIDHGNGFQTRYLHLAYGTVNINVGDRVTRGQIIGFMGNTGNAFGAHLHFEVLKDGNRINPTEYLDKDFPRSNNVNVYYRVRTVKHGWLPEVRNLEDYAGWENSPITDIAIRVDRGSIRYRVHVKGSNWLPYVTGYDINDLSNGYAGNGKVIDAVEVYYETPDDIRPYKRAKYKVNEYPWQYDNEKDTRQDGYAGAFGVNVTKLQIEIV